MVATNLTGNQGIGIDGEAQVAYDVHLAGIGFAAIYFYGGWNFGFRGNMWQSIIQRIRANRAGIKIHRPTATQPSDETRADTILDKIHRQGQDSLTAKERKFMEEYSRRVRQKRET